MPPNSNAEVNRTRHLRVFALKIANIPIDIQEDALNRKEGRNVFLRQSKDCSQINHLAHPLKI